MEKRVCTECGSPARPIAWTYEESLADTKPTRVPTRWRCDNPGCISQKVPAAERQFEIAE